jgi:hypothetical protein
MILTKNYPDLQDFALNQMQKPIHCSCMGFCHQSMLFQKTYFVAVWWVECVATATFLLAT